VGKTVYLYAPTFREADGAPLAFDPQLDFSALDAALCDDEVFAVTRHPVMPTPFFAPGTYAHVLDLTDEPTGDLLCCANVLATDYSSVIFDAALLGVPCVFYCPDRAVYERSFYLEFDRDLPGPVFTSAASLLPMLREAYAAPDRERLRAFCEQQAAACDGHATERIVSLILSYLAETK
jgi:CDP-glycerol glycerophosphotransferase (TagB/SpsB family)